MTCIALLTPYHAMHLTARLQGWVSGADYAGRKTTLVLFINGRAVECNPLKRALEATYATILPKASKPFVYLVGSLADVVDATPGR